MLSAATVGAGGLMNAVKAMCRDGMDISLDIGGIMNA